MDFLKKMIATIDSLPMIAKVILCIPCWIWYGLSTVWPAALSPTTPSVSWSAFC